FRFGYCDVDRSLPSQAFTLSIAAVGSPEALGLWNKNTRVSPAERLSISPAPIVCRPCAPWTRQSRPCRQKKIGATEYTRPRAKDTGMERRQDSETAGL